jgi:hypothetical protein
MNIHSVIFYPAQANAVPKLKAVRHERRKMRIFV